MGIAKAAKIGLGVFTASQPLLDIYSSKKEGYSTAASIGRGLTSYGVFELFPGLGFGLMAKDMIGSGLQIYKEAGQGAINKANASYKHGFGDNFIDTQNAYTMRQRGLAAIRNNGINARSVLGNEARMYARGRYE